MKSKLATGMLIGTFAVASALGSFALPASASPGQTPTGYTGACNMLVSGPGMVNAMSVNNANGDTGMFRAVAVSGCS